MKTDLSNGPGKGAARPGPRRGRTERRWRAILTSPSRGTRWAPGGDSEGRQRVFDFGRLRGEVATSSALAARHSDLPPQGRKGLGMGHGRSRLMRLFDDRPEAPSIRGSGSCVLPRPLTSHVRRGHTAEAEVAAAAGADRRPVAVAVVGAPPAPSTPRGALREPRRQPSPHYATACGGPSFGQSATSIPPRLKPSCNSSI